MNNNLLYILRDTDIYKDFEKKWAGVDVESLVAERNALDEARRVPFIFVGKTRRYEEFVLMALLCPSYNPFAMQYNWDAADLARDANLKSNMNDIRSATGTGRGFNTSLVVDYVKKRITPPVPKYIAEKSKSKIPLRDYQENIEARVLDMATIRPHMQVSVSRPGTPVPEITFHDYIHIPAPTVDTTLHALVSSVFQNTIYYKTLYGEEFGGKGTTVSIEGKEYLLFVFAEHRHKIYLNETIAIESGGETHTYVFNSACGRLGETFFSAFAWCNSVHAYIGNVTVRMDSFENLKTKENEDLDESFAKGLTLAYYIRQKDSFGSYFD